MTNWATTASGLHVPEAAMPARRPIAIDLFAGAGGFSCGFHQAGWHVAAAVEFDTAATATYLLNMGGLDTVLWTGPGIDETLTTGQVVPDPGAWHPERCADVFAEAGTGWITNSVICHGPECAEHPVNHQHATPDEPPVEHFFKGDIRKLTGRMILDALGLEEGDVGAVIGGPPCQGFSRSGQRDVMDPRNSLVFDFARIVCEIQPKTFVMENVTGIVSMLTPEGVPVLDALALVYEEGGFGTYDALRRSLYASSGHAAALKSKPPKPKLRPLPEPEAVLF